MSVGDPFAELDIPRTSSIAEIRRAWRNKAREAHPDAGGSHAAMQLLNEILEEALSRARVPSDPPVRTVLQRDVSSFTVAVSPIECFIALEVVAAMCGPVVASDNPVMIEFMLHDAEVEGALNGWCRCDLIAEAGATMVSIAVGSVENVPPPHLNQVRDYLVDSLNAIDWPVNG